MTDHKSQMDLELIQTAVESMLEGMGFPDHRAISGLRDTPNRVARAWQEMLSGYKQDPKKVLAARFPAENYDELVVVSDIEFFSTCEHHLLSFSGVAHVGYLPDKEVVGLSKLGRLVDIFARRLQIQERMTAQINQAIIESLNPRGCGVVVEASHLCMACRGVMKPATMKTSALHGALRNHETKTEFFTLIYNGRKSKP